MACNEQNSVIDIDVLLTEAIVEMSKKGLGVVSIVDKHKKLSGILTDGDLRRIMEKRYDVYKIGIKEVMTSTPSYITEDIMAVQALKVLKEKSLNCLPVIDKDKHVIGTITLQMLMKAGIVL